MVSRPHEGCTVIIFGSGGREHTLAWKLAQSPYKPRVLVAPGNGCIPQLQRRSVDLQSAPSVLETAQNCAADIVIFGPEAPLVAGHADNLREHGIRVFGPSAQAARLEGSKIFTHEFCERYGVPTAPARIAWGINEARTIIRTWSGDFPPVVKADGLAGGKGVKVADTMDEASAFVEALMVGQRHGLAGNEIVFQERLRGAECSIMALVDGTRYRMLEPARDYKRALDGDSGENTGGMGAYSPVEDVTPKILNEVQRDIIEPTIAGMDTDGTPFQGLLYAGLMLTKMGPKLLEFNVRFGDPETQVVLPRLKSDLLRYLWACSEVGGGLGDLPALEWSTQHAVGVGMTSGGYPEKFTKGFPISGLKDAQALNGVHVFHAGTKLDGEKLLTDGGRVLAVVGLGSTRMQAQSHAYSGVERIFWAKEVHRSDIGN